MPSSYSVVIIQSICTTWTKSSRGGASASLRNHTPEACDLPAYVRQSSDDVFLIHELIYAEHNHFQQTINKIEQKEKINPFKYNCFKLSRDGNILDVTLEWERCEGVPRRVAYPRKGFFLQNGQWGRIVYNLRTAWEGCWAYKKYVLNIGLFSLFSPPAIFLDGEPTHTYRDLTQLW